MIFLVNFSSIVGTHLLILHLITVRPFGNHLDIFLLPGFQSAMAIEKWDKVIFKNSFAYSRCPYIYYTYIFMLMLLFRYIYFLLCFKICFFCVSNEKKEENWSLSLIPVNLIGFSSFFWHVDVRFLEIFF